MPADLCLTNQYSYIIATTGFVHHTRKPRDLLHRKQAFRDLQGALEHFAETLFILIWSNHYDCQ